MKSSAELFTSFLLIKFQVISFQRISYSSSCPTQSGSRPPFRITREYRWKVFYESYLSFLGIKKLREFPQWKKIKIEFCRRKSSKPIQTITQQHTSQLFIYPRCPTKNLSCCGRLWVWAMPSLPPYELVRLS